MRIYDVTLTLSPGLVVWPGDPPIMIERRKKMEEGANDNVSHIEMSVHSGTHVDAPYHFLADGEGVEKLSLKALTGRAYVLHLPEVDEVTAPVLERSEIPPRTRRLLLKTRNSEIWAQDRKDFETGFVGVSPDAAEFLVNRGVKLVGIDYLSIAPYKRSRPTHEILLKAGIVILEGLDLSRVSQGRYTLYCLPLKLAGSDGAPARAIIVGV